MRALISKSTNSNSVTAGSAGNQERKATGVSGEVYDMSYMAKVAEAAEAALGDMKCTLSMSNIVARTANNVDDRTAAEKMFATGTNGNFKFTVYFTKEDAVRAIDANKAVDRRIQYELEQLRSMCEHKYNDSAADMMKIAAKQKAKSIIASKGIQVTQGEWEKAMSLTGTKAAQYGINTIELAMRASTVDESLRRGDLATNGAWGINDEGKEFATYNASGTKTLPLFTEDQVEAAKKLSEELYKEFAGMYSYALNNPSDYKGMFDKFCECARGFDSKVPANWKCKYSLWTTKQREEIERMANRLVDMIERGE